MQLSEYRAVTNASQALGYPLASRSTGTGAVRSCIRKVDRNRVLPALVGLLLASCTTTGDQIPTLQPALGSNEVLQGPILAAPGHSLLMGDLVLAPGSPIARHLHAGEEFLYVLGGSITISVQGKPDVTLAAGEGLRIAPGEIHQGQAGPQGTRAVASWVRVDGQPLRTPVPE